MPLEVLGGPWGDLRGGMGVLGRSLGVLGGSLGGTWCPWWVLGGPLGDPWESLGGPWEVVGESLGDTGGPKGTSGVSFGALFRVLGRYKIIEKPLVFIAFS